MKQLSPPLLLICIFTVLGLGVVAIAQSATPATEAPTGFDNLTNGMVDQLTHDTNREVFEESEGAEEGLGPVYNAEACSSCHQNPVTGAISQITELRAGHRNSLGNFVDAAGGSLINDRAIHPDIQERVPGTENVRTFRTSLNTLGDGFVEAIDSNTLLAIANSQPGQSAGRIAGQFIQVPVLEAAPGTRRGGRFGWKNQHASLVSFSADAYLNEMGITSPLQLTENTSMGRSVANYDKLAEPEDNGEDIQKFADFMRASKAPSRDLLLAATPDARIGQQLFTQIGCNICHVASITTAPAGTVINGGAFTVPPALGSKVIHPYSDFLLHNVGTGDGIVQNGGQSTANKLRTAPLWGLRTRDRLMHDGEALTRNDAILRHGGEATFVINNYRNLSNTQKNQLVTFLNSL
jgi:CxxC motif-containing protein (DUF1111 family)